MTTAQCPVPLHAPDHPVKVEFASTAATSSTVALAAKLAAQVLPHAMPPTEEVTVPLPVPAWVTVRKVRARVHRPGLGAVAYPPATAREPERIGHEHTQREVELADPLAFHVDLASAADRGSDAQVSLLRSEPARPWPCGRSGRYTGVRAGVSPPSPRRAFREALLLP